MVFKRRFFRWFLTSIGFLITLLLFLWFFSPSSVFPYPIPPIIKPIYILFFLVFCFFFTLMTAILKRKRRGMLFAYFVCGYLLLRLYNFTDPVFAILLLSFFLSLEILLSKIQP